MTIIEALQDIGKGHIVDNGCDYMLISLAKGTYIMNNYYYNKKKVVTLYGTPAENARKIEKEYYNFLDENPVLFFSGLSSLEYIPENKTTYATQDGNIIKKIGKAKQIYFNNNGEPYFVWNGRRQKLEEVMRLSHPVIYTDEEGKLGSIGGYITISNCYGVLVEVDPNGESIQLYEEIND